MVVRWWTARESTPSSPECKPGILPLNDEPILAGRTGFEPVGLFADNEAATLAASRPLRMVPAVGFEPKVAPVLGRLRSAGFEPAASARSAPLGWSAGGDSNPDLHGLKVPRLPIAPRAE